MTRPRVPKGLLMVMGALALFGAARSARAACASDADCTTTPLHHCDSALPAPACVECRGDGDCAGGLLCERQPNRAGFTKCVQCTEVRTATCTAQGHGSACLSSGTCGCVRDDDCGEARDGRVCTSGACTTGCRGDGSRPCQPGESCTARGTSAGVCVREPLAPPLRADAGPPNPTPPIAGGGGCEVARIGRAGISGGTLHFVSLVPLVPLTLLALFASFVRRRTPRSTAAAALVSLGAAAGVLACGCSRTPTPLRPGYEGSIGLPHKGVLVGGTRVDETPNLKFLRDNERRWSTSRFANALVRAADHVAAARPGGRLVVGDLSAKGGGVLLPHLSHRSGRDADLLLYVTTLDGAPVDSPGFVHVREDGLAWDERGKRFLRFDVERQWLFLKALLTDEQATVQFVFASRTLRSLLAEWAVARGEPYELVYRAITVLVQPNPGGEHDDHFHVRSACTAEEIANGCEASGPERPWLALARTSSTRGADQDEDGAALARLLFEPLDPQKSNTPAPASVRGAP